MNFDIDISGPPGPSVADSARREGSFIGATITPDMTDHDVLDAPFAFLSEELAGLAEIVAVAGFSVIDPARAATTANITLSGEQTIDGVSVAAGNRVLVKNQSSGGANGIYVASAGAWSRATDFDQTAEVKEGSYVNVTEGTTQIGAWVLTTADPITVGTTAQVWRVFRSTANLVTRAGTETISNKTFAGAVDFIADGGRALFTSENSAVIAEGIVHIRNVASAAIGLDVEAFWVGSSGAPYANNDCGLFQTYNNIQSSSANFSWSVSAPNAYHNIPAGVTDSGERVGVYGWATSIARLGYVHAGTLGAQTGVKGNAGFQGTGSAGTAIIQSADGVQGNILSDSPGATIATARAGAFTSLGGAGNITTNIAVYGKAINGTTANYSFYGDGGRFFNLGQVRAIVDYSDSGGAFVARNTSNVVEFGYDHPSNIGATVSSGFPFLALCAEADPSGDTYRTRGSKGAIVYSDLTGALIFARLTGASASGQTPTENARYDPDGHLILQETPVLPTKTPASAGATGIAGEACWDASYIYICTATNTWKRVAIATW